MDPNTQPEQPEQTVPDITPITDAPVVPSEPEVVPTTDSPVSEDSTSAETAAAVSETPPAVAEPVAAADPAPVVPVESSVVDSLATDADKAPEPASMAPAEVPTPAVISGAPKKRHFGLVVLILLVIVVAAGLFLVYHYGQAKSTPVATVEKDVPLVKIGEIEPLPASFYPNVDDDDLNGDISNQAFEGLTGFENKTQIVPRLATSWTNPDTSTWVFKIRPNVKFHTGKILTATDVVNSLNNIQKFQLGPIYGSTIKTVSATGPLTVEITTNGPDALLPNELTQLNIYDTTSTTPNSPVNGTGAYTLKSGTAPTGSIDLVAYDQYWGGRPHVRELQFYNMSSDAVALAAIQAKTYNLVAAHTNTNTAAGEKAGYASYDALQPLVEHIMLNSQKVGSPLAKVAVRNALMQALDPTALAKSRDVTATPASQIIPPQIPGYDPSIVRPSYDVAAAKAALTAAGYPNGFSIQLTYYESAQDIADAIKQELALAGVTVNENPETDVNTLGAVAFGGQTDMFINGISTSLVDGGDVFSNFIGSKNYDDPQFDALYQQESQTLDIAKRLALLKQMSDLLVKDRADLPLYSAPNTSWLIDSDIAYNQATFNGDFGIRFVEAYGK
jgi:peptide/nickel transport system substrate-binding protein